MSTPPKNTIVITGGTGGIGYQAALGIAQTGAKVIITGRNLERGEQARQAITKQTGNPDVFLAIGDVSSTTGLKQLAANILQTTDVIDILINNAGHLGAEHEINADGFEMHFAINVFAPYQLTKLLLSALQLSSSPKVFNITGGKRTPSSVDIENLQAEKGFKGFLTYIHSKSTMEAMSVLLAKELEPEKVAVNVLYPGAATTVMTQSMSLKSLPGLLKLLYPIFKIMFRTDNGKSAKNAAFSSIWAATTTELDGVTGQYFDSKTRKVEMHPSYYTAEVQEAILQAIQSAT